MPPYLKKLRLVLLTHQHSDHFRARTLQYIHEQRPTVRFLVPQWLLKPLLNIGISRSVIDSLATPDEGVFYTQLGSFYMTPTPHDVPNCAWHIFPPQTGEPPHSVFYATDCANLDNVKAKWYGLYLLEANYREAELEARMQEKLDAGEYSYETRAAQTHLSEEQAKAWIAQQAAPGRSQVIYLHQHRERRGRKDIHNAE